MAACVVSPMPPSCSSGVPGLPRTQGDTLLVDGSGWAFSLLGPGARMDHGGDYDAIDAAARQQVRTNDELASMFASHAKEYRPCFFFSKFREWQQGDLRWMTRGCIEIVLSFASTTLYMVICLQVLRRRPPTRMTKGSVWSYTEVRSHVVLQVFWQAPLQFLD